MVPPIERLQRPGGEDALINLIVFPPDVIQPIELVVIKLF